MPIIIGAIVTIVVAWLIIPTLSFAESMEMPAAPSQAEKLADAIEQAISDKLETPKTVDDLIAENNPTSLAAANTDIMKADPELKELLEEAKVAVTEAEQTAGTEVMMMPEEANKAVEPDSVSVVTPTLAEEASPVIETVIPTATAETQPTEAVVPAIEPELAISDSPVSYSSVLAVSNAWAKPTLKGQMVGAAYMTLENKTSKAVGLVNASASVAGRVEIHNHMEQNGVMQMRKLSRLDVMPNGSQTLKPGGLHLMLFDLMQPLQEGQDFTIDLTFADGSTQQVAAKVRNAGS